MLERYRLDKCSPRPKQFFRSIQSNLKCNDEGFEQATSLSKLCMTRWTARACTYIKVLTNYESLMKLWDTSLKGSLEREARARIVGCQAQMTSFKFAFTLNLACQFYAMTDNPKMIQKESFSEVDS